MYGSKPLYHPQCYSLLGKSKQKNCVTSTNKEHKNKSRKKVNFELESSFDEDNTQTNLTLIFSTPDNKKGKKFKDNDRITKSKLKPVFSNIFSTR